MPREIPVAGLPLAPRVIRGDLLRYHLALIVLAGVAFGVLAGRGSWPQRSGQVIFFGVGWPVMLWFAHCGRPSLGKLPMLETGGAPRVAGAGAVREGARLLSGLLVLTGDKLVFHRRDMSGHVTEIFMNLRDVAEVEVRGRWLFPCIVLRRHNGSEWKIGVNRTREWRAAIMAAAAAGGVTG